MCGNLKTKGKIAMKQESNNMVFWSIDACVPPLKLRTMPWSVISMGTEDLKLGRGCMHIDDNSKM